MTAALRETPESIQHADTASDGGSDTGAGNAELGKRSESEHQGHNGFRESDRRDRVRDELRDKKDIDDGKKRLHRHLDDHRNREQKDGAANGSGRVVSMRPGERLLYGGP